MAKVSIKHVPHIPMPGIEPPALEAAIFQSLSYQAGVKVNPEGKILGKKFSVVEAKFSSSFRGLIEGAGQN